MTSNQTIASSGGTRRPGTGGSPKSAINETIRVICRLRPTLPMDAPMVSSPREGVGAATFITPESMGTGGASSYESYVSNFTPGGDLTYSKNWGEEVKSFKYSGCVGPDVEQEELYSKQIKDIVSGVMDGYHGTILAYGQTGSGKTYTMEGEGDASAGVIPRSLRDMFEIASESVDDITFSISYLQIYCEVIYDMLDTSSRKVLSIREKDNRLYVENLTEVPVKSVESCLELIKEGDMKRATASTLLNAQSSRSHAALLVTVTRRKKANKSGKATACVSNLVMVDLAGSERAKQSGAKFQQFEELKAINLSLSALGNCVSALAANKTHVPYRDSKLTRLLQHTLGGNSRTAMVVCVRPGNDDAGETYSTLMFAMRASNVKVLAKVNTVLDFEKLYKDLQLNLDGSNDDVHRMELEVANLKIELEKAKEATQIAESQREALNKRFEMSERGFQASLAAAGGEDNGDLVEAIEGVSEKWQQEVEAIQQEHVKEIEALKMKHEQNLKAYKAAANSANFDTEEAGFELERAQKGHLETLENVTKLTEKLREAEEENSGRIAELLDELNAKNLLIEELEGGREKTQKAHNEKITELVMRLEELEEVQQSRKADMVSREAVLEMETLFSDTVEKLMHRVNQLEGKAKENREVEQIGNKHVDHKIQQSRQKNGDPQAMSLLAQMEQNVGGRGVRVEPGRLRARNGRKQAF
ncbi:hypothetical protein TrST_g14273 [Triparma strigata]|uniref:Kinesin motor domain-containing protein n=1 Tax=Triparma strigata TaxID=1606541 RepID=A0A9W7CCK9_9STRA|nr:hypothetical protein TrST_g14273 [Triparma strigata]